MRKGKFIVIEGGEGSGKSTMLRALKEIYPKAIFTREPGGSPLAEKIRYLLLNDEWSKQMDIPTQHNLFWAAREDHIKNVIRPALERGENVISDRFDPSSWAYQVCQTSVSEGLRQIFFLQRKMIVGEHEPNLYILLDVDPVIAGKRKAEQAERGHVQFNHFDAKPIQFHHMVRRGLIEFMEFPSVRYPYDLSRQQIPHHIVNTDRLVEEVRDEVIRLVQPIFESPVS